MSDTGFVPTAKDREMAFDINAVLMALHQDDLETLHQLLVESESPTTLLVAATATLKSMLDTVIEAVNESDDIDNIDFPTLVRYTAEYLLEVGTVD